MLTQMMMCVLHAGERNRVVADLLTTQSQQSGSRCRLTLVPCDFAGYKGMLQCEAEMLQASLSNIHNL